MLSKATRLQALRKVVIPVAIPAVFTAAILAGVSCCYQSRFPGGRAQAGQPLAQRHRLTRLGPAAWPMITKEKCAMRTLFFRDHETDSDNRKKPPQGSRR